MSSVKEFEVKLSRRIVQHYEAYVTVRAVDSDSAMELAIDMAERGDEAVEWSGDECDGRDNETLDVDEVTELPGALP